MKKIICILSLSILMTACNEIEVNEVILDRYVKLDSTGNPLVNQDVAYSNAGDASEANFNRWSCVLDKHTGLIWEVKKTYTPHIITGGADLVPVSLQDSSSLFTWYDPNPTTNGGERGVGDLGDGTASLLENDLGPIPFPIETGSDDCIDKSRCDTDKYIEDINALALCGGINWRLPTIDELAGMVFGTVAIIGHPSGGGSTLGDGVATIDPNFFPNISPAIVNPRWYSSTTSADNTNRVWAVDFQSGYRVVVHKRGRSHIMLVRDPN